MRVLTAGTIMVDILAVDIPRVAEPGDVVYVPKVIETRIGGHPIDVAIDLVKLGISPDSIGVIAALGEGLYASFVKSIIDDFGIKTFLQNVPGHDVGKNIVLEVKGEDRRFHIDPGANWFLKADYVETAIEKWKPDIFCLRPGYCGIDLELEKILAPLRDRDTLVFLDIMCPHPSRPKNFLEPIFSFVDIIHCNEKEALINTESSILEEALDKFFYHGVKMVFVTLGKNGARVFAPEYDVLQPPFKVAVVDATGCGDAFCAGVVYELMHRKTPLRLEELSIKEVSRLLTMGQAVGASAATAPGCVEGVSKETVEKILKSKKERRQ